MNPLLQDQLKNFPESPGVYIMRGADGNILYIGKAINLKKRVKSYFTNAPHNDRLQIPVLMEQVETVECAVTKNEAEALILEAELVRKHLPKYNVLLRDDKRFPYLKITVSEPFARVIIVRKIEAQAKIKEKIFGPYTDGTILRRVADFARRVFKIRTCNKKLPPKKPQRPCINFAMKRCAGPCAVAENSEGYENAVANYRAAVGDLIMFLNGKRADLLKELERRMSVAASELRFEDAASYRNQIRLIRSAPRHISPDRLMAQAQNDAQVFLSHDPTFASLNPNEKILEKLQTLLKLKTFPNIIEAFDISNLGASFAVAGMVRFVGGRPDKKGYRRYKIKTVDGQNDFAMMLEAVSRRLTRLEKEARPFPDLILIDGGKGQLHAAMEAIAKFKNPPQIASLAKREELLFSPNQKDPVALPPSDAARKLVERIRDEVHRFAITYHRKLRGKQFKRSGLESVEGVGKAKAQLLLKRFGSIEKVRGAEIGELCGVRGVTELLAQKIKDFDFPRAK